MEMTNDEILRSFKSSARPREQVAILAPTTILVQQHFNTLKKRLAGFPVKFDMLCRFRSPKEQKEIARKVKEGEIQAEDIDEQMISSSLYTASMPDPDLIIRTSGEYRLSNFLMWQASYAEFYFTDVLWPDFNNEELEKAIDTFAKRDRRYGLVK